MDVDFLHVFVIQRVTCGFYFSALWSIITIWRLKCIFWAYLYLKTILIECPQSGQYKTRKCSYIKWLWTILASTHDLFFLLGDSPWILRMRRKWNLELYKCKSIWSPKQQDHHSNVNVQGLVSTDTGSTYPTDTPIHSSFAQRKPRKRLRMEECQSVVVFVLCCSLDTQSITRHSVFTKPKKCELQK